MTCVCVWTRARTRVCHRPKHAGQLKKLLGHGLDCALSVGACVAMCVNNVGVWVICLPRSVYRCMCAWRRLGRRTLLWTMGHHACTHARVAHTCARARARAHTHIRARTHTQGRTVAVFPDGLPQKYEQLEVGVMVQGGNPILSATSQANKYYV